LTPDNGKEFAYHEQIAKKLDTKVYFANPYSSWECGLNEHTNDLLRQCLPKKIRFDNLTEE
jgi:IS30 family transposase